MISYQGIFFENEAVELISSIETNKLPVVNDEIHCTFKYHPTEDENFNQLVGKEVEVYLIGYGFDDENSGFQIVFPNEYVQYYNNYDEENKNILKVPHITASLAIGAKASNTKKLNFMPLDKPIRVIGRFGYWVKEDTKEYVSYSPYINTSKTK